MAAPDLLTVSPLDADDVRERTDRALSAFLDRQERLLASLPAGRGDAWYRPLIDHVRAFLRGGKRLRPAFCYWGWRGAGGDPDDPAALDAACSLELLHAFALIHDDIMDGSETRRDLPSAHVALAGTHRAAGWRGSSPAFGTGAAILLGDLCLGWSRELLAGAAVPPERLAAAQESATRGLTELIAGQYLDLGEQARGEPSVERARAVIRFKTAKYTIEQPLHLGALLAGGSAELRAAYSEYALPLGEAFQLRDDVLGVFGDSADTGKPVDDDLREGKNTVLVALTLGYADPAQAAEFTRLHGRADASARDLDRLREIITDSGALDAVEAMIKKQTARALDVAAGLPAEPRVRDVLAGLAIAATDRRR